MKLRIFLLFVFLFFFFSGRACATITTSASSITPLQVFDTLDNTVTVTISGASSDTLSYIRPLFFQSGSTNYFGCVKTTCGTYYCGADSTLYPSILGSGSITLTIRVDTSSSGFSGSGAYLFKARRCTVSGCTSDFDSNEQTIEITKQSSTPQPSPKDATCPFPTPTPVPATPTPTPTPSPSPTPSSTPSPTPVPSQPTNISLSEFVACPSSGSEWVELYNGNNDAVTLSNWKIKDNTDSHTMTVNDSIDGKKYKAFDISGFSLNNNGDNVRLYDGAGSPIESRSYTTCNGSQSWAKKPDGTWEQTPLITKGSTNQFPTPVPTPSPTPKITPTPSPDPTTMEGAEILGTSTDSGSVSSLGSDPTPFPTNSATVSGVVKDSTSQLFAFGAIGLGMTSLCGLGGYLWYDWWKKKRTV